MSQPPQQQDLPGVRAEMDPKPDCGEESCRGHGRLTGKVAVVTGGDSGIGRAVTIAYAREGADVLIAYLNEEEDARYTARLVEEARRIAVLVPGDLADAGRCRRVVDTARSELGKVDVLVSNAAHQMTHPSLDEITDEEFDRTFRTNVYTLFHLARTAVPHMAAGSSVTASSSINSDMPNPTLAPYAATKAAIANFCASSAELPGDRGIRVNSVAPGPIWTPLIPSTMPPDSVEKFGRNTPLGRPGQPVGLAPVHVLLASDEASYISRAHPHPAPTADVRRSEVPLGIGGRQLLLCARRCCAPQMGELVVVVPVRPQHDELLAGEEAR